MEPNKSDELVVVQSPVVLGKAVELGGLTQVKGLLGRSSEEIIVKLRNPKLLDVRLGSNDANSNIINIGVTTEDADLSGEIVLAIVLGYENYVTQKFKGYSKNAIEALERFSNKYEKKYKETKSELANLKNKSGLIFVDGKPRDLASDNILSHNESILSIDNKMKNIESMLEGLVMGKERGTPNEVLLKMIALSTFDRGIEDELQRRKTRLNLDEGVFEKEFVDTAKDDPTIESRLSIAIGVLQATLVKLSLEKGRYSQESANLQEKTKENQAAIGDYLFKLAELESVGVVAEQISENLRKLNLGAEFGQKTVTRLDVPATGSFVGPYMNRYLGIGALLGFVAFCGLACLDAMVSVRRTAS